MIQMTKKEAKLGREKPHLDCFDDSFAKFTVKRPVKKRDASEMEESAPKSSGGIGGFGKRVLPECVVGVDPKQGKKKFEPKKIRVADETDDTESSTKSDVSEEEPPAKKKSKASSSKLSFQFEDE